MTKSDLVGIFRTSQNNCKLVYASMVLFAHDDAPEFYAKWSAALDIPKPFDQDEIVRLLRDRKVSKIAFTQLYDTVHRAAIKELFEVAKDYCDATDQSTLLTGQPWYQFWRVLRNCFSHDFRFRFTAHDKKLLPVSWRNVTIDESMDGKHLTHGVLSREQILAFIADVNRFVETDLS